MRGRTRHPVAQSKPVTGPAPGRTCSLAQRGLSTPSAFIIFFIIIFTLFIALLLATMAALLTMIVMLITMVMLLPIIVVMAIAVVVVLSSPSSFSFRFFIHC